MSEVKVITITETELENLLDRVCRKAILDAFAQKDDEILNIGQICERIPGMSRYLFSQLQKKANLKNIRGKYSLNAVKAAMQSH
ncbi:hypothetical protein F993_01683 [Acinetobacter proteolyticus]|uniref:Uncharacterized protein n=1 Tax=Acinetobacter proteolyticus TaxID=1776741 RepID=A0ABP2TMF2_9GAMM|nr:hypothetical protein [Acinetobacter proteolyticus]ENU23530.1 hypothetical protein F993_01683 [Acinetobacter proteolyticus]